ncbi:uncharacterized protein LOC125492436 [Beta vulgaris subsp. vulgaris]|uniref:uncharacterized protein LOC125492436 n=1 Tax=Beta vulgaris subsp. vulgaris TaxID=3555 RepID=UPI0020374F90|nr:uncharacterized protein LOC125492436 [Beta vulgaris subsp. vulgaris]
MSENKNTSLTHGEDEENNRSEKKEADKISTKEAKLEEKQENDNMEIDHTTADDATFTASDDISNESSDDEVEIDDDRMKIMCPKTNQIVQIYKSGPSGVVSRLMTDFEEVKFLGAGGYGCVVEVRNKIDRQHYALKKIKFNSSEIGYEYVVREARAMAKLNHRNIVRYHTAWLEKDIVGIVTKEGDSFDDEEYSEGVDDEIYIVAKGEEIGSMLCIQQELCYGSLEDIMGELAKEKIKSTFEQILNGVAYLHNKGIVHGDLSPSNIFLDETKEVVKIGDFGLANLSNEEHIRPTTCYRALELGDPCIFSKESDIYSLGIILVEMLAKFSYIGEKIRELKNFQESEIWPESLKSTNDMTKQLIKEMTNNNPLMRPTANYISLQTTNLSI